MTTLLIALAFAGLGQAEVSPPARVVLPASGTVVDSLPSALPGDVPTPLTWRAEGTLTLGSPIRTRERLLASEASGARVVTIEVQRQACPPLTPAASPWPTIGYAGIRQALPERRAVTSCKQPDLMIELRFPAAVDSDEDALYAAADRFEPAVVALHQAFGAVRVDLGGALAARTALTFEPPDAFTAPLMLMMGLTLQRTDGLPWTLRSLGGHDTLTLVAPTAAGLAVQLIPFGQRFRCSDALPVAVRALAPTTGVVDPPAPAGFAAAKATGNDGAAVCAESRRGGVVAIVSARVPRDAWWPVVQPLFAELGARVRSDL